MIDRQDDSSPKPDVSPLNRLNIFWHLMLAVSLFQLAVTQPILDLLGKTPDYFVAHDSGAFDILLFTALLSLFLPLCLMAILWLLHFLPKVVFSVSYLGLVILLLFAIALPPLHFMEEYRWYLSPLVALACSILSVILLLRVPSLQEFSKYLALGTVIVPLFFLLVSPVSKLIFSGKNEQPGVSTSSAGQKNETVVLLVFDALPLASLMRADGSVDAERFPGFGDLASQSVWYRNAVTVSSSTFSAIPAILTGQLPVKGLSPTFADHPNNLFSLLKGSVEQFSYQPLTKLCPPKTCRSAPEAPFRERFSLLLDDSAIVYLHLLLPESLRASQPPLTEQWRNFRSRNDSQASEQGTRKRSANSLRVLEAGESDVATIFAQNIAHIKPRKQSAFYFQHLMMPHIPWRYLPSGQQYEIRASPSVDPQGKWLPDSWLVTQSYQRHLLQLGAVDTMLGRILQHLRDQGMFDEVTLVVAADHGVNFEVGMTKRILQEGNSIDLASVPLFIKYPQQKSASIVDTLVSTVDIAPTILTQFSELSSTPMDGSDLRSKNAEGASSVMLYYDSVPFKAITRTALESRRQALVERKEALFPTRHHGPNDWFFPRDEYGVVGQSVEDIESKTKDASLQASIWRKDIFRDVELQQKSLPVRIMGGVLGANPAASPLDLAIAVNGKIAAVTRTYVKNNLVYYSSMLPTSFLAAGNNAVAVYALHLAPSGEAQIAKLSD